MTRACNDVVTRSTEIDAVALFGVDGRILAINSVYADGRPIAPERVERIVGMSFAGRDIVQACIRNSVNSDVLEFQTQCDITPAFFDSTGLSVAFSTPIHDPASGLRIGVISSRMRFSRLDAIISGRSFGLAGRNAEFVTDAGAYFSEEINAGKRAGPVDPQLLAKLVQPLVQGQSRFALTHVPDGYVSLFRLTDFQTLNGGGIQLLLKLSDEFLAAKFTQARRESAAWWLGGGIACFSLASLLAAARKVGESERLNHAIVETAMDAVVMVNHAGRVTRWNPAAERALGVPRQLAIGTSFATIARFARPGERDDVTLEALAASTTDLGSCEVLAKCRDGRELCMDAAVVRLGASRDRGHSLFLRDVTERRAMQHRLAQAQKLESVGQLAAGIAHEINTPVQYVSDNVRFLQDQFQQVLDVAVAGKGLSDAPGDAARADALSEAIRSVDFEFVRAEVPQAIDQTLEGLRRVATIVRAMKEFSHPGSHYKAPADLNQSIRSTAVVCTSRWKAVAQLHLDLDPDLPALSCLVAEINQVVLNLIVNAADAIGQANASSGKLGNITIRTRGLADHVEIRIEDDGPGMSPEVQRRLFEPFFTTKGVGKGTGQGLAISRNVIEKKHAGTLRFETTEGKGTTFIITMPLRAANAEATNHRKEAA